MAQIDPEAIADELVAAYGSGRTISIPLSARDPPVDLAAAYAIEGALTARRRAAGLATVGRKVGFANKAVWRALKLDTLVWANMYDDTVQHAAQNRASYSVARARSPKIEPEIVFKLKAPLSRPATRIDASGGADPAAALGAVEWLALGFEIIECVFADWKFQPADFVAAYGFHAALFVGDPMPVTPESIPGLVDQLAQFKVTLLKNDVLAEEGGGRNVLRSPALCLAELASAIGRQPGAEPLAAGELVSSGTLTTSQLIGPGETWTAVVDGLALAPLTLSTIG